VLEACDRVLFLDGGRVRDGPLPEAWLPRECELPDAEPSGAPVCRLDGVTFGYGEEPVVERAGLTVGRGEIVACWARTARARRRSPSSPRACSIPGREVARKGGPAT